MPDSHFLFLRMGLCGLPRGPTTQQLPYSLRIAELPESVGFHRRGKEAEDKLVKLSNAALHGHRFLKSRI